MKKRIPTFLAGMVTMALVGSFGVSALAATGTLTITVAPINIQVNGQTFQPKDAQGNSVPVFAYNGTTYAPLRALAEAYGLEVGYDAERNMATVGGSGGADTPVVTPDVTVSNNQLAFDLPETLSNYDEFKSLFRVVVNVSRPEVVSVGALVIDEIQYDAELNRQFMSLWNDEEKAALKEMMLEFAKELENQNSAESCFVSFGFDGKTIAIISTGAQEPFYKSEDIT